GREDQVSHRILRDELRQDRVTARAMPIVFALVTAFLIHMVLTRLVASQRDQIAILKAFGYSNAPIVGHFLKFAAAIVIVGSAVGVPLGMFLGAQLASLYRDFFSMPDLRFMTSAATLLTAPLGGILVAISATVAAVTHAVGIAPAEGMRGEQPAAFHATALDRFHRFFSSAGRMVLRSVERRPLRATLSVIAIAASVMILVAGRFTLDALDNLIEIQFRTAQRDDLTISFVEPVANSAGYELARLPGVRRVETFRATPARIRFGHSSRRIALMGLSRDAEMRRLTDLHGNTTAIPPTGVVLTGKLARILGIHRGDVASFETLEGRRTTIEFPVVGIVDELMGINAYVDRDLLQRKLDDGGAISGAHVSVDPAFAPQLDRALKRLPTVGAAAYREIMLRSFRETIAKNMLISMTAMIFFACVIAFGVIYNNARIALSERGRDLASLRVLGFTHREVGALLLVEHGALTLIAIPIGFGLGRLVALWFVRLFDTEGYRLPATVSAYTYAFSFVIVAAATIVSGAMVWRRVRKLDLIEVLKTRE
ncbi:MAG TPA: FtsX-like permease family protein, partial [Thermoanaerobaculia bacterium]|nr:FtsX-like permease family protein [Thermoanaerobaculia bacterium]